MTRLCKMMLEELQRRNFSEDTTIRHYIHATLQPSTGSLRPVGRSIRKNYARCSVVDPAAQRLSANPIRNFWLVSSSDELTVCLPDSDRAE